MCICRCVVHLFVYVNACGTHIFYVRGISVCVRRCCTYVCVFACAWCISVCIYLFVWLFVCVCVCVRACTRRIYISGVLYLFMCERAVNIYIFVCVCVRVCGIYI